MQGAAVGAVADVGHFVETFTIDFWLELMHQRERVTNADEMLANRVGQLLAESPRITRCVSSERPHRTWTLLSALVLGLLIWTAYGVYAGQNTAIQTLAAKVLQLRYVWLAPNFVDRLRFLRGPGEGYSDVILRLAASERRV